MEKLQWSSQPVLNAVDTYLQRQNGYAQVRALEIVPACLLAAVSGRFTEGYLPLLQSCETTVEILGDVVSLFGGDAERVDKLRQAAAAVLVARRSAQLHSAALQELKGTYVAGGEPTPFEKQLKQHAAQLGEQQP
jgi:hypothetical protein